MNNLSVAKNAKENLGVTSFFTTSPAYGLSQQVIYLTSETGLVRFHRTLCSSKILDP